MFKILAVVWGGGWSCRLRGVSDIYFSYFSMKILCSVYSSQAPHPTAYVFMEI